MSDSLQPHELPGSSVHGISQARVLEWGATAFSAQGVGHCQNKWKKKTSWKALVEYS